MAFDMPRGVILPVDRVAVRLETTPHPFEAANRAEIDANWAREIAAKPALFNGTVVLLSKLAYSDGALVGSAHAIPFAGFLLWRRKRPIATAEHAFAHAMLTTTDNKLIAIRMGGQTLNSGKVYFAAGSFEPEDFPGGMVDVDLNMAREVGEETGIAITGMARDDGYHAWSSDAGTVIFRRYHLPWTAAEAAERIRTHVAAEEEPEIEGPVVIDSANRSPPGLVPYMTSLVAWHFDNPAGP